MKSRLNHAFMLAALLGSVSTVSFATTKPVLNDWFALGSGCRAKSDLSGNVRMEQLPADPAHPDTYRVKFTFTGFELRGDTADKQVAQFARECAVRLNINPPAGKKLVELRAKTAVSAGKDIGASLDLLAELKLGAASLGTVRKTLDANARAVAQEDAIDLASGAKSGQPLPSLGCSEAKIIGFDYSWIARREKQELSSLSVDLGREKSLILEATLAECKS